RAPTPSAAAEMVVARKDEFVSRIDRLTGRVAAAMSGRLHRSVARLRSLEARPGYAGLPGRVVFAGRRADDLSHELRRAMRARLAKEERSYQSLRLKLETFDVRRRFGVIRTWLVSADGRLGACVARRVHAANVRLGNAAARLDSLSPLAVLGRGYAVCFNED